MDIFASFLTALFYLSPCSCVFFFFFSFVLCQQVSKEVKVKRAKKVRKAQKVRSDRLMCPADLYHVENLCNAMILYFSMQGKRV